MCKDGCVDAEGVLCEAGLQGLSRVLCGCVFAVRLLGVLFFSAMRWRDFHTNNKCGGLWVHMMLATFDNPLIAGTVVVFGRLQMFHTALPLEVFFRVLPSTS
jgi:hypothetical protein